jgi:hypothetical protein
MEVESGRCVRSIFPIPALFPVLLRSIHAPFRNVPLFPGVVPSAALINAAQAAEHYKITRYGSRIAWASILRKTLDEEKATDKKLTTLAESRVNLRAAS